MLKKLLHPRLAVVLHDLLMAWLAWIIAYGVRYSIWPDAPRVNLFSTEVLLVVLIQGLIAWYFNLYRGLWRFASIPDLINITKSAVIGTLAIAISLFLFNRLEGVPRSVLLLYPFILVVLWGAPRLLYRIWKDARQGQLKGQRRTPVLVAGAGRLADLFIRNAAASGQFDVRGVVAENPQLAGARLRGVKILGGLDDLGQHVRNSGAEALILAFDFSAPKVLQSVVNQLKNQPCRLHVLPDPDRLNQDDVFSQLQPLTIEDLLGRDPVSLDWSGVANQLKKRTVLVTGGGGSIGSELCRQLAALDISQLIVVDQSEFNLYSIDRELKNHFPDLLVIPCLADVTERPHMQHIFHQHKPEVVFHAAAYKHVPLLENMPCEAFLNNVFGTQVMADLCDQFQVADMVLISTDKAVHPHNVMGATKRIAEKYCQWKNGQSTTRYRVVRFGNVLGSAGSVVPLFREQIARGGPVTITHPDMTRYFMTIEEAAQLILHSAALEDDCDTVLLDMGEPVNIRELAEQMICLSGKIPQQDIPLVFTGLRPGEKLTEQLLYDIEKLNSQAHGKLHCVNSRTQVPKQFVRQLEEALHLARRFQVSALKKKMQQLVPEYQPHNTHHLRAVTTHETNH
jgi:FlaA1/EpsC-like NDP-sugar epimerase